MQMIKYFFLTLVMAVQTRGMMARVENGSILNILPRETFSSAFCLLYCIKLALIFDHKQGHHTQRMKNELSIAARRYALC